MTAKLLAVLGLFALFTSSEGEAQSQFCNPNGSPQGGAPWVICVNPWAPITGNTFEINFSGELCSNFVIHEFDIQLVGNTYTIYYDYLPGFCPGVPSTPRHFSQQSGIAAGDYIVQLYQRRLGDWPPPPFNPGEYTFMSEVNFTVRGALSPPAPVPGLGVFGFGAVALGLILGAAVVLRSSRKINFVSN